MFPECLRELVRFEYENRLVGDSVFTLVSLVLTHRLLHALNFQSEKSNLSPNLGNNIICTLSELLLLKAMLFQIYIYAVYGLWLSFIIFIIISSD